MTAVGVVDCHLLTIIHVHFSSLNCFYSQVYDVTAYMPFHPGGVPELMLGVGRDGSELFDEVHRWVNFESMLASCFVGNLLTSSRVSSRYSGM